MSIENEVSTLVHPSAELSVLAGLCSQNTELAIELSKQIDPMDFSSPFGQVVAEAALRILRGYEPLDAVTMLAACRDVITERRVRSVAITPAMVEQMMTSDTSRSASYAVTVKRYAWLRRARQRYEPCSISTPNAGNSRARRDQL